MRRLIIGVKAGRLVRALRFHSPACLSRRMDFKRQAALQPLALAVEHGRHRHWKIFRPRWPRCGSSKLAACVLHGSKSRRAARSESRAASGGSLNPRRRRSAPAPVFGNARNHRGPMRRRRPPRRPQAHRDRRSRAAPPVLAPWLREPVPLGINEQVAFRHDLFAVGQSLRISTRPSPRRPSRSARCR